MKRVQLMLVVAASACGKTASSSGKADEHAATAPGRKPCDYVKRKDAEAAVGLPLPTTEDDLALHECRYTTPEYYGSVVTTGDWDTCKAAFAASHPTAVANLGDEAYFLREHVIIRKGERCLGVSINGPLPDADKDDGLARVKALALTILPTF
jgi:hypothetical protein